MNLQKLSEQIATKLTQLYPHRKFNVEIRKYIEGNTNRIEVETGDIYGRIFNNASPCVYEQKDVYVESQPFDIIIKNKIPNLIGSTKNEIDIWSEFEFLTNLKIEILHLIKELYQKFLFKDEFETIMLEKYPYQCKICGSYIEQEVCPECQNYERIQENGIKVNIPNNNKCHKCGSKIFDRDKCYCNYLIENAHKFIEKD